MEPVKNISLTEFVEKYLPDVKIEPYQKWLLEMIGDPNLGDREIRFMVTRGRMPGPKGGVKNGRHAPKFQHDCDHCRFSWCCGYLCSCILKELPEPSDEIKRAVNKKQIEYGYSGYYKMEEDDAIND